MEEYRYEHPIAQSDNKCPVCGNFKIANFDHCGDCNDYKEQVTRAQKKQLRRIAFGEL